MKVVTTHTWYEQVTPCYVAPPASWVISHLLFSDYGVRLETTRSVVFLPSFGSHLAALLQLSAWVCPLSQPRQLPQNSPAPTGSSSIFAAPRALRGLLK